MHDRKWEFLHLRSVGSTNEFLRQYEDECPVFVRADVQTSGRGRLDRGWISPWGGLYASFCIHSEADTASWLQLLTGVCATDALATLGADARLKWPNDIMLGGKKAGGILAQSWADGSRTRVIVGTGINVNNLPPLPTSTSVAESIGGEVDLDALFDRFFKNIMEMTSSADITVWKDRYRELCDTIGREVCVQAIPGDVWGIATGVDDTGALLIQRDGSQKRVLSGDCAHVR